MDEEVGGNKSLNIEQGVQNSLQLDGITSAHTVDHGDDNYLVFLF